VRIGNFITDFVVGALLIALMAVALSGCERVVHRRTVTGSVLAVVERKGFACATGSAALYVAPGLKEFFEFQGPPPVKVGEQVSVVVTYTPRLFSCDEYEVEVVREGDE
jgi:hypothetical protein